MRKNIFLTFSLIFIILFQTAFSQGGLDQRVTELSQQIAKEMTDYQKTTIAVLEFSDLQGNVTDFGRFLAEKLITRLYQTKKFKVIERQLLNKVINEQKLSLTGMVDPTSAKQLGKILGVDAICSGSITDLAQSIDVNARLISTETGEIFSVASTEIFKDESVMKLIAAGTTANIPSGGKPITTSKTPTATSATKSIEAEGFLFKVVSCKWSAGRLVVIIQFLNNGNNERTYLIKQNGTYIYDNFGNQYPVDFITIGKISSKFWIEQKFLPQVPVNVSFIAEDVSPEASYITIAINIPRFKKNVVINDIPISR